MEKTIKVCLVDDHVLLRNGLAALIRKFGYDVHSECDNGKRFIDTLKKNDLPDIVLMDINMPVMDGYDTTLWLKRNFPLINVIALSMYDDEPAIIRMLRNGARGYILKNADPMLLKTAIEDVLNSGFHYSDKVTGRILHHVITEMDDSPGAGIKLNEKEIQFLKLAGSDLTYKEIAEKMFLSPRTIDGYREALFAKLDVKSRVGLVLYAIREKLIQLN
jgi:two-component system, NarL family, invasion response regulator UvrY